jgi:hypothetical protein
METYVQERKAWHDRREAHFRDHPFEWPEDNWPPRVPPMIDIDLIGRVWYPIQSFLTAIANISKALWGQHGDSPKRVRRRKEREPLRQILGVDDSSPLWSTDMRNNFDHFDERIENWQGGFVDLGWGNPDQYVGFRLDQQWRNFDPTTLEVLFWGERYDLPLIARHVASLRGAADRVTPGGTNSDAGGGQ